MTKKILYELCSTNKFDEGIKLKINSISSFGFKKVLKNTQNKQNNVANKAQSDPINQNSQNYGSYNLSFGKSFEKTNKEYFNKSKQYFTQSANRIWQSAYRTAQVNNHALVSGAHLLYAVLNDFDKCLNQIEDGTKTYNELVAKGAYGTLFVFEDLMGSKGTLNDPKAREEVKKVVKKYIAKTKQELQNPNIPKSGPFAPRISNHLAAELNSTYDLVKGNLGDTFVDSIFLATLANTNEVSIKKLIKEMRFELQKAVVVDNKPAKQKNHLQFYDDKADRLWKNLDLGNNVYITYEGDNQESISHLLSSFANLIKKPGQKYNNLNAQNTEIVIFNKRLSFNALGAYAKEAKKDPDKTYIFVIDFRELVVNSAQEGDGEGNYMATISPDETKLLENGNLPNVRIVLYSNKDNYYANTKQGVYMRKVLLDYPTLSIPTINAQDTKEILTSDKGIQYIQAMFNKKLSAEVIGQIIDITNEHEGYFPEKALEYAGKLISYFIDKDEITLDDTLMYENEIGEAKSVDENQGWFKVISNTGKKLDDIAGSPMTKAEAKSVVNFITSDKKGYVRGYTTYLDNGTSYGGGRRHVAECIAGEAQIPMITINARDFALKDIDALSQNSNLSELKIRQLIDTAKAQAEANKNKTAMIFIENFDNFASSPYIGISSIYEQKAFSQLLAEMDNLRRNKDINLVVIGSANYPQALDENIMKPNRFLNKIVIYSPQDPKETQDVIKYYLDKNNLQVGTSDEEKNQIIQRVSKTSEGLSVVDLIYMIDKAQEVSRERGKSVIDEYDFREAYLQTTTGRVSSRFSTPKDNEITAKHECGHALSAQVMYNIAKKEGKPWRLPFGLDFIALDPRANYGAITYFSRPENNMYSFERVFADIVCSFGGYSTEKYFYDMKGSWGIYQDMDSAATVTKQAVMHLGMGAKTGRMSFAYDGLSYANMSESMKEKVEQDVQTILVNAESVSNKIISAYSGFVEQFGQKYANRVGTGDCIINADEFQKELEEWENSQTDEKREELLALENEILHIIEKTKKGEQVTL